MVWPLRLWGALCVVGTVLPLLPTGFWLVRGWDFPRFQLAILLVASIPIFLLVKAKFKSARELTIWVLVLFGACIWQAAHVIQFTPLWRKEVASTPRATPAFRLVVANLDYENVAREAVLHELLHRNADILILIEMDESWSNALAPLRREYRYRHEEVIDAGLGLALWSKLPLANPRTRFLVEERRPSIWVQIAYGNQSLNLVAVHPTPPGLQDATGKSRRDSRVRDAELVLIAKEVASDDSELWIVAGDFNDVAWSHTTRLFKRLSGLKDPRVGRSFMGTYHADYPVVRFPIDHVFVSDGFSIAKLQRHRITGSDHFAVSASIAIRNPSAGVTPEPQRGDHHEAKNLIEQGEEDAEQRGILSQEHERTTRIHLTD